MLGDWLTSLPDRYTRRAEMCVAPDTKERARRVDAVAGDDLTMVSLLFDILFAGTTTRQGSCPMSSTRLRTTPRSVVR